ncbi:MAG: adenylosuccinate synthase [Anaerolineaceae bacterium]|nr:adenylosuccinate synthase [Anaerolineaceae bacterium]
MPMSIVVGAQWGDEGKGRFVDWLAQDCEIVARFSGGDNAGHTIALGDEVYKMHLIPSGILNPGTVAVMGNGMVINPVSMLSEMERLRSQGVEISPENLIVSDRAHIITPAHIALDKLKEYQRGDESIGTTLKGIGPAYLDKVGRSGLRVSMMTDVEEFAEDLTEKLAQANAILEAASQPLIDVEVAVAEYVDAAQQLRPYIQDTVAYFAGRLHEGARVVCEGAQGSLLDVDFGSYPFVTSSNPTAGGAITGLGVGPTHVSQVLGVAKAFNTRVGGGPMPTELDGELGDRLRGTGEQFWDEFGTTTGRKRRCGWLDAVILRYSAAINGFTHLALTKLDILSGFEELKIAVAYEIDGQRVEYPPSTNTDLAKAVPIYETMPGWQEDVSGARTPDDLPQAAKDYIQRISELCDVPVLAVGVGPERSQVVAF